jgi:hypothetical protein
VRERRRFKPLSTAACWCLPWRLLDARGGGNEIASFRVERALKPLR